ncbi:MAG: phospho-sugar mutase, partial [Oscillospiraceae bacterium]|nr:phospho-sugar mutase [Oscillospiraceae bacterium]
MNQNILSFGTGGIRGIMGAGAGQMNESAISRVTRGLADYVKEKGGKSVCIAYDTRNNSCKFAQVTAEVLCACGIEVFMFTSPRPTPMLSFAVREKKAFAGVVITASHNPREYNGYKVYGADGGQITDEAAGIISAHINKYDALSEADVPRSSFEAVKSLDNVDGLYYEKVKSLVVGDISRASELSILYTPLHGSGNIPVRRVLG